MFNSPYNPDMNPVFLTTTTCECRVSKITDQQATSSSWKGSGSCAESSGVGGCPKCMLSKVPSSSTLLKGETNANANFNGDTSNYKTEQSVIIVSRRGSGSGEGGSMVLADDVKNKLCKPVQGTYKYPNPLTLSILLTFNFISCFVHFVVME